MTLTNKLSSSSTGTLILLTLTVGVTSTLFVDVDGVGGVAILWRYVDHSKAPLLL